MFILVFSYGRTEDLNPVLEVKTASIEVWSYFEAEFAMTVQGWAVGKENNWKMKEVGYKVLYKYETTLGQIICVCTYIYIYYDYYMGMGHCLLYHVLGNDHPFTN